ncbi:MAG: DHHA1 domain-containing protein, partial [Paraglaciecola sp.]|nr:DHHA1 domain-containing protein [Paraglaciecola sp.]
KYDDDVRVVSMGEFSMELCGGTHVMSTGDIGLFKILSESGIAAGVRRIEAVTGSAALELMQKQANELSGLAAMLKTEPTSLVSRITQLLEQNKIFEKELAKLKQQLASSKGSDLLTNVADINGVKVLVAHLHEVESKALRGMVDEFKNQLGSAVIVLGVAEQSKVSLIVGVTQDLTSKVKAGELVNYIAQQVGGKGGGRPDMAQAGGNQPENLANAIESVKPWLINAL